MLAPPCIRSALLIPEKNNTRQVSATIVCFKFSKVFSFQFFFCLIVFVAVFFFVCLLLLLLLLFCFCFFFHFISEWEKQINMVLNRKIKKRAKILQMSYRRVKFGTRRYKWNMYGVFDLVEFKVIWVIRCIFALFFSENTISTRCFFYTYAFFSQNFLYAFPDTVHTKDIFFFLILKLSFYRKHNSTETALLRAWVLAASPT